MKGQALHEEDSVHTPLSVCLAASEAKEAFA